MNQHCKPTIHPCAVCGRLDVAITTYQPAGMKQPLYRAACPCGSTPSIWSLSVSAAARFWNRYMALGIALETA